MQLGERRLHGDARGPSTRARRRRGRRRGRRACRACGSSSGVTTVAPSRSASARRVGCGSLTTTSVTPRRPAAAMLSAPIGPHPGHEDPLARFDATTRQAVERDRERFGQRRRPHRHAGRDPQELGVVHAHEVGEGALELADAGTGATGAELRSPGEAVLALTAACAGPPTTSSPGDHPVTSSPTATTRPEYSCPPMESGAPQPSTNMCRSLPQTPQWLTSRSTSCGPSSGTGRSSTATSRGPRYTAARIVAGRAPAVFPDTNVRA